MKKENTQTLSIISYNFIVPSFEHGNKRHWSCGIQLASHVKQSSGENTQKAMKLSVHNC